MNEEQIRQIIKEELSKFDFSDRFIIYKLMQFLDGRDVILGTSSGSKFGTASTQKIGFLGTAPVSQQTSAANLTNNVTAGGTNDTIANFTDLSTYANDAAAIRNDIYQLSRKLKQVNDALRLFGLLS